MHTEEIENQHKSTDYKNDQENRVVKHYCSSGLVVRHSGGSRLPFAAGTNKVK